MPSKKMVAKVKFDDGSKVKNGQSVPYEPGEDYKGNDHAKLKEAGLVVTEDQFKVSQEKAREALKDRKQLLQENDDLRKEVQALKKKLGPKKGL